MSGIARGWYRWNVKSKKRNGRNGTHSPQQALESLETRILPAVDLIVSAANFDITSSPPDGSNQHGVLIGYTVKNLGTTPVDITGVLNDSSDNLKVRIYKSLDAVWDVNDPQALGFDIDINDSSQKILAQNQIAGSTHSGFFNANQSFNFFIFVVDWDGAFAESNNNNNTFVVDASKPDLVGGTGIVGIPPKATSVIDSSLTVRDLNTTDFNGGNFGVLIDSAQVKDKLGMRKSGEGSDKLHIAGNKLKLGAKTIGIVSKVIPSSGNGFQLSLQINFTDQVSRDVVDRAMRNITFRPGAKSSGTRLSHFQVKDNLENLSNVKDRTIDLLV